MMDSGSGRRLASDMNIIPFLDVMMVLLVVFMMAGPGFIQGLSVNLPKASAPPVKEAGPEPLVVSVDADELYYINVGGEDERPIPLGEIGDRVAKVVARNPGRPVLVRGDQEVVYGAVIRLMGTLSAAGVEDVRLVTDPPPRQGG